MRPALRSFIVAGMCLCGAAAVTAQQPPATSGPAAAAPLFAKPVVLRGTLGDDRIQVNLRPKADIEDGYEGDYFLFGTSQKILLAGGVDGEDLALEESENGTDISGQWEGKVAGDTISGSWQSVDGTVKKPFKLTVLPTSDRSKSAVSKPVR